ncbi:MAG: cation transporter [Candidatus Firestonebacteria bacterium]|nr:cation transporter [Candidatus Firestonebacteria bacterium]
MISLQNKKTLVATFSVISNTFLVLAKIFVGVLIGSVSVISEAIHSGVDLVAAIIALVAVRTSGKPADKDHPFGHGKIENISGTIEALLIFLAAGWIIYEAIQKLLHPRLLDEAGWGVLVMFFSAVMNMVVSNLLFKVGKETDSMALQADAWHLRTDVWTSMGVMGGLACMWAGKKVFPGINLQWLDPVAAIGVALLIVRAAYDLTLQSGRDLLDTALEPAEIKWVREIIFGHVPPVCGYHRLRTRKAGADRFVDFHLLVNGHMTLEASHDLTDDLEGHIEEKLNNTSVTIHIEPCNGYCSQVCREGCLLSPAEQTHVHQKHQTQAKARKK